MARKKESTGEEIYSGTATFGRVMAVFGVIMGTLAGLILIPLGIYFMVHKTKLTSQTPGKIDTKSPNPCTPQSKNNTVVYDCSFNVNYTINGTQYSKLITVTDSSRQYYGGDNVTIYYDPKNPNDASITQDNTHILGIILLIVGIIIPIIAWVWWYFARKYKAVAAAGGVAAGLDLLSGGRIGGIL